MQIIKDGEVVYNSIDNAGTSDNAALGARYAKGRLDTLESEFDNYFDKSEVLDLLEQKSAAQFVNQLPATLADNTWYYSKKYADGTDVPNDKRALYAKDSLGVTQYLGVVGDVDLTDYQEKQDNTLDTTAKTVVGGINENKAAIDAEKLNGHLFFATTDSMPDSEYCVFDFTDIGELTGTLRTSERRVFGGWITDPIAAARAGGIVETTQFLTHSGGAITIYIEQHFFKEQSGNKDNRIEFRRKGYVTLDSVEQYTNWVATKAASITWKAWVPIEYPATNIPTKTISGVGQLNYAFYAISGGILTFRGLYSATSQIGVEQTIWNLPVPMKNYSTYSIMYVYPNEAMTGTVSLAFKPAENAVTVTPRVSSDFRLVAHIPLGY